VRRQRLHAEPIERVVVAGQGDHLPDDSPTPNAVNVDDQMDRKADSFSRARMRKADVGRQHAMRQGVLNAFYNWCIAQGFAASNPVCKVKFFNDNNERCRYLTDEEWERLRTAAPAHGSMPRSGPPRSTISRGTTSATISPPGWSWLV
jgi:hypothetical protein